MKKLLLGLMAPLMVLSPASAEVQPGTNDLIETVGQYMTVNINTDRCNEKPNIDGSFAPASKTITVCTGDKVDANDHDTVRHEVWHAIQWCMTDPNDQFLDTIIEPWTDDWYDFVMSELPPKTVKFIQEHYPAYAIDAELEAFAAARILTASEIKKLFLKACVN